MSEMLEKHPGMIEEALAAVGKKNLTTLDRQTVARTQECLFSVLNTALPCFDPTPQTQDCVINLPLLEHWQRAAKDPDDAAVDWLLHGAPAGIINPIPDRGIFPQYAPEDDIAEVAADDLATDMNFSNYTGVEGDAEVRAEFDRLAAKSYTREFCSLREAEAYVRGKIVLSKIGVIRRWRNLAWKLRMVVDSKASGISRSTRKFERTMLPRALDVVLDTLELMDLAHRDRAEGLDSGIEYLIADFRDAFYLVPNHPAERKFFCVKLGNKYIVFTKTAQGSRGAPLTWARIAALVTRLTQTVIGIQRTRMSTYVDDPIVVAVGSAKFRKDTFARVLLIWSALQLPLAFDKAVYGPSVTWTSAVFCPLADALIVRIKESIVLETGEMAQRFLTVNYLARKELRSFIGKVMHIASLVIIVRPFVSELYGALYSTAATTTGWIWLKQIRPALAWIALLLSESNFKLERRFDLAVHQGTAHTAEMCLDASPWGCGGFLTEGGKITAWFATAFSMDEKRILSIKEADCSCQQTVEALAVLIALRCWSSRWRGRHTTIRVKSDSISALVLALNMKSRGVGASIVARELALDVAASEYCPHVAEHIPGTENVTADSLSRRFEPKFEFALPTCLNGVAESVLKPRSTAYFKTQQALSTLRPKNAKKRGPAHGS